MSGTRVQVTEAGALRKALEGRALQMIELDLVETAGELALSVDLSQLVEGIPPIILPVHLRMVNDGRGWYPTAIITSKPEERTRLALRNHDMNPLPKEFRGGVWLREEAVSALERYAKEHKQGHEEALNHILSEWAGCPTDVDK